MCYRSLEHKKRGAIMNEICHWTLEDDWDGINYDTQCGEYFCITAGTPKENGFVFCTFCGNKIVEVKNDDNN